MVGDREHDVLGAKEVGISSLGVLYGYGSKDELCIAKADCIAKTPADIIDHCVHGKRFFT
jgi:phosphoglycolate phosphatase